MTRTLHVCLRNGLIDWDARKSLSEQMESPASVSSSIAFESSVRRERPLWMRSVVQPFSTVGGLVRTTKAIVEENVLGSRDAGPRLMAWVKHHAAQVICVCMVGTSGLTPFRRLKGRKFGTPLAGFGERVWLGDPVLEKANKFNPRCTQARLLGFCLTSSCYIVVDFDGRFRMVRTIKRANADDRWKVVSPRDPLSAADLESTPAEFSCSRGTRA